MICVNPEHLFFNHHLGDCSKDKRDKTDFRITKFKGPEKCQKKLTEEIVREIRSKVTDDNVMIMAKKYKVTPATIYDIKEKRTWRNLDESTDFTDA